MPVCGFYNRGVAVIGLIKGQAIGVFIIWLYSSAISGNQPSVFRAEVIHLNSQIQYLLFESLVFVKLLTHFCSVDFYFADSNASSAVAGTSS